MSSASTFIVLSFFPSTHSVGFPRHRTDTSSHASHTIFLPWNFSSPSALLCWLQIPLQCSPPCPKYCSHIPIHDILSVRTHLTDISCQDHLHSNILRTGMSCPLHTSSTHRRNRFFYAPLSCSHLTVFTCVGSCCGSGKQP